jgi:hypothetical protein
MNPRRFRLAVYAAMVFGAISLFAESKSKDFTPMQKRWWAFQPIQQQEVPAVQTSAWVRNDIDAFVLAKLDEKEIVPNPRADKVTLIRRAALDLTGLPPTLEEVQAFLADSSPNAFEKVVDRLVASPHYGERWARHWLDVARYADSEGFKADETRPNVWRYRDYVIQSFNQDKPYDRFVREQIAGDELYPGDPAALVAVGFNRHFPDESNAANIMQRRQELLNDVTDTVGLAFMAMTVGCARCHDHKFDPILQKDYYRLQAFFANTRIEDDVVLAPAEKRAEWERKNAEWLAATAEIRAEVETLLEPHYEAKYRDRMSRFPEEIQAVIAMAPAERNPYQWQMFHKAKPQVTFTEREVAAALKGEAKEAYTTLQRRLAAFDHSKPEPLPVAQTMADNGAESPTTYMLAGGAWDNPQEPVNPGFLTILDPSDAKIAPPPGVNSTGRRAALANWLASPENPLTARVMVNRVWHYHFGRGLAGTPNDFGVMGERPTHRELLDHLAWRFMHRDGWSLKKLHKAILMSNTWQQSSQYREEAAAADPDNKLLWRFNRRRLEGEAIRDSMLHVSGLLNTRMGGPGVFPPLPPGVETRGGWKKDEDPDEALRRGVYVFVRRNTRYPMFEAFDMPDTHESCARRMNTVSSTQALELLNNELVLDWAAGLARRVANDSGLTPDAQVDRAYRLVYSRPATDEERRGALRFLDKQAKLAGGRDGALQDLCHALLNSNEFLYLN